MTNDEFQSQVIKDLGTIKTDIGELKEGQKRLETRQDALEAGMGRLEVRQDSLEEGQKRLETRQDALEASMGRLEVRQDSFDSSMKAFIGRQDSLEAGQKRIEKKLDAVIGQTVILTEFRTEVNMKLDNLIEDNKSIHEMLGEHEISIRTLRRKPV